MNKIISILVSLIIVLAMIVVPVASSKSEDESGVVYTMTNNPVSNQVIRYDRTASGVLSLSGTFPTNGAGTGNSLDNQGGLVLSEDGNTLLVVNAGSNEISAFRSEQSGLVLTDKISSGGIKPTSITIHKDMVYVVNADGNGNIAGFHISNKGKLKPISGSTRPLSGPATGPAQISFSPDGTVLVVTEKSTNLIDIYTVDKDGVAHGPIKHISNGLVPFGFAFDKRGHLVVSEAIASALSSYAVDDDGNLKTISRSVLDSQGAACWVVVTKNGKFAYTNNAHSGTISSYKISQTGKLSLLNSVAGRPGAGNIDLALSKNSKFLYSLNSGAGTIAGFWINSDGSLTPIATVSTTTGVNGLAAR